jgi:putative membrane protein
MEYYNYLKPLHLIFVITWFAGLFYIVRLFVTKLKQMTNHPLKKEILQTQYKIMTYRLWYIITSGDSSKYFCILMLFFHWLRKVLL